MSTYLCQTCGEVHDGPPLNYGADAPTLWYDIPPAERDQRALLSSDQCIIDDQFFFIVGKIEIPIHERAEMFSWSVWVSLSAQNFERADALWNEPGREAEPPYFGWVSTSLPLYPPTLHLKSRVHTRPVGQRPAIELEPTDHPLAVEQRTGIPWTRVIEIASALRHDAND